MAIRAGRGSLIAVGEDLRREIQAEHSELTIQLHCRRRYHGVGRR
jgi:hypothetical protein